MVNPEGSADRMLESQPLSTYTIDNPAWEGNSCCTLQKNPLPHSRGLVFSLLGFAFIATAAVATFGFFVYAEREESTPVAFPHTLGVVSWVPSSAITTIFTHNRTLPIVHKKHSKLKEDNNKAARVAETDKEGTFESSTLVSKEKTLATQRNEGEDYMPQSSSLPGDIVPQHYHLLLHPHKDDSHSAFSGMVHIQILCVEETRRIILHAAGIQVNTAHITKNVTKNGTVHLEEQLVKKIVLNSSSQVLALKLVTGLTPNATYNLSFTFVGVLSTDAIGFHKATYTTKNGTKSWIALTHMKTRYARHLFPCFDDPTFRTTFDVQVLRRKDLNSISNMPILRMEVSTHVNYVNDVFLRTPPIPTYLLGVAVTDFSHIAKGIVKVWTENASSHKAEICLRYAITCLQNFEKYFAERYPLPKLDIVVPPTNIDAQQSFGIVVLPSTVLDAKASEQSEMMISMSILKQWIGGITSFSSSKDFWLEDSLCEFISYDLRGDDGLDMLKDEETLELKMHQLLAKEAVHSTYPLTFGAHVAHHHAFESFASQKALLLLRMFHSILPPHFIRSRLKVLLNSRKYSTISQDELWVELTNVSQPNVNTIPDGSLALSWTHNAGFPLVTLHRTYGKGMAVISQTPYRGNGSNALWEIPVTYTIGERMEFENKSTVFWLTSAEANLPDHPKDDDWVILNVGGFGYYRVNYDVRNWNLIVMELNTYHNNIRMMNRARILDDLYDLASEGLVPYGTALHATEYLRKEKELLPWLTASKRWHYVEAMLSAGDVAEKWKLFVTRLLIHHIHSFKWSFIAEESAKRQLRTLHYEWACRYRYGPCVIEARHAFELYKSSQFAAKSLLPEHQVTVFCTVVEDGGMSVWQFLYNRLKYVSSPTERTNIIIALGCSQSRSTIYRYLHEFSSRHFNLVPRIFSEVTNRNSFGKTVAMDFLLDNWKSLKKLHPKRFTDILFAVFNNINTVTELSNVNSLYNEGTMVFKGVQLAFQRIERKAQTNIKWMSDHYDAIARWLKRDVTEFILDDQRLSSNFSAVTEDDAS
ncbi:aminopeptidase Ey-like [Ornithodoros turicata]|uniref:aminopeptidase Ey-like n=1 Tax=Ornithodoros turicata TaxID=34597 RepID=UPI003139D4A9